MESLFICLVSLVFVLPSPDYSLALEVMLSSIVTARQIYQQTLIKIREPEPSIKTSLRYTLICIHTTTVQCSVFTSRWQCCTNQFSPLMEVGFEKSTRCN